MGCAQKVQMFKRAPRNPKFKSTHIIAYGYI